MRTTLIALGAVLSSCGPVSDEVVIKNPKIDAQIQSFIDIAAKRWPTVTGYYIQLAQRDSLLEFVLSQGIPSTCDGVVGFKRYGQSVVYFLGDSLPLRYMDAPDPFACDLLGSPRRQEQLPDPPYADILYFDGRHFYRRQIPEFWSTADDYHALPLILAD